MLDKNLDFQGIQDFWNNLPDNQGSRFFKAQVYGLALKAQELREKEDKIRQYLKNEKGRNFDIHIINDDFQIVDNNKEDCFRFSLYYQYKPLHECTSTFDLALLGLICYKLSGTTAALPWIKNMLNVNR
jgi:hypothetical protein